MRLSLLRLARNPRAAMWFDKYPEFRIRDSTYKTRDLIWHNNYWYANRRRRVADPGFREDLEERGFAVSSPEVTPFIAIESSS